MADNPSTCLGDMAAALLDARYTLAHRRLGLLRTDIPQRSHARGGSPEDVAALEVLICEARSISAMLEDVLDGVAAFPTRRIARRLGYYDSLRSRERFARVASGPLAAWRVRVDDLVAMISRPDGPPELPEQDFFASC